MAETQHTDSKAELPAASSSTASTDLLSTVAAEEDSNHGFVPIETVLSKPTRDDFNTNLANSSLWPLLSPTRNILTNKPVELPVYSFEYLHVVGKFTHHILELRGDAKVQLTDGDSKTSGWHGNWWQGTLETNNSTIWVVFHHEGDDKKAVTVMFKPCRFSANTTTFQGATQLYAVSRIS